MSFHGNPAEASRGLEEQLTNEKLIELQMTFKEADEDQGGGLDMDEFKCAMRKTMGEELSNEELDLLFMKVDTNCDGTVDWDEYLSYMLLEYTEKDIMNSMVKEKTLPLNCKSVQNMHEYQRRHDYIVKIQCLPVVTKLKNAVYETSNVYSGRYLTITKDGILNSWTVDLGHLASQKISTQVIGQCVKEPRNSIWVTNMVVLPNFNMIAVATSTSSLIFYEMRVGGGMQQTVQIVDMEIFITSMDYWHDPKDPRNGILLWGDARGNICALKFFKCYQVCILHPSTQKKPNYKLSFSHMLTNKRCGVEVFRLTNVHKDFVLQVKYCPTLGLFLSCCGESSSSLFLGDLENKRKAYFQAGSGTTAFDYCKTNNVIVSGGKDAIVRIWNPYLTGAPLTILHGHKAAVTNIIINETREHIISISEDKELIVFDMESQICIQQISKKYLQTLGQRSISAAYFNQDRQALVLGTTQLAIWEHREEERLSQALTTHSCPMPCVLYNKLFKQVVTGSTDSLVCVWDIETGKRIIQFFAYKINTSQGKDEHVPISVMTFDSTLRRLITGAQNGSVKIWNFNNGACLNELEVFERMEVAGIISVRQRVITAGWNRRLTVYMDARNMEDEGVTRWPIIHKEEIIALACNLPSTIASASYDGDILIWSLDTGCITMAFNAERGVGSLLQSQSQLHCKLGQKAQDILHNSFNSFDPLQNKSSCEGSGDDSYGATPEIVPIYEEDLSLRRQAVFAATDESTMRFHSGPMRGHLLPDITRKGADRGRRRTCLLPPQPIGKEGPSIDMHKGATYTLCGKSVEKLIFLESRKSTKSTATLVSCGDSGWVRMWSVDHEGGMIGQFNAAHIKDESVTCMATDEANNYLITADSTGYVKVWDIEEYCIGKEAGTRLSKRGTRASSERLKKFRLLDQNSTFRRKASNQKKHTAPPQCTNPSKTWRVPLILTSFRGHLKGILDLCYLDEQEMIVTTSSDCSVRMWSITGLFIGIFGRSKVWRTPKEWTATKRSSKRSSVAELPGSLKPVVIRGGCVRRLPPDVRRVASATSLRMFYGGDGPLKQLTKNKLLIWLAMAINRRGKFGPRPEQAKETVSETDSTLDVVSGGDIGTSTILGSSYQPSRKHQRLPEIQKPRTFQNQCAVYSSLPYYPLEEVDYNPRPPKHVAEILAFSRRWQSQKGNKSKQKILPVRSVSNASLPSGGILERTALKGNPHRKHRP